MSGVPNAKGSCPSWSGRYSFCHTALEQALTARTGHVLSMSDTGGTPVNLEAIHLQAASPNEISRGYNL
jgi:hypothetical protein